MDSLSVNLFTSSCFITGFLAIGLGVFVLSKGYRKKTHRAWFLLSLAIFIWSIALGGTTIAKNKEIALFWQRILYIGTILLPVLFLDFCSFFTKVSHGIKRILWIGSILTAIFLISVFTKFFIAGIEPRTSFGYWPIKTGVLYPLFLAFFAFYISYSFILLKKVYNQSYGIKKRQISFLYYGALIGFIGGSTNFLLDFDIKNFYPFGNFFIALYIVIVTYAMFKYHLMEIKLIATQLSVGLVAIILFVDILLSNSLIIFWLKIGIFFGFLYLGYLLIKSVLNETNQRQRIAKMAKELAENNDSLKELNGTLDEKVKERTEELEKSRATLEKTNKDLGKSTKEIEDKEKELEKWYNLTVGRELKMIELKKKIEELKGKDQVYR